MMTIAICPGCNREIATDDDVSDERARWCLNCGGLGDPNRSAVADTRHLLRR
jgi:hypothetical protein